MSIPIHKHHERSHAQAGSPQNIGLASLSGLRISSRIVLLAKHVHPMVRGLSDLVEELLGEGRRLEKVDAQSQSDENIHEIDLAPIGQDRVQPLNNLLLQLVAEV